MKLLHIHHLTRKLCACAVLATILLISQSCGVRAANGGLTAADFKLPNGILVYNEMGVLMPNPDCVAYNKLGIKPTGDVVADMITLGKKYLGKPYRYRGAAPWPFDCSGYMRFLFNSFGIQVANSSAAMAASTETVKKPEPGDLLFFKGRNSRSKRVGHVGLLIDIKPNGNYVMLHSSTSRGIIIEEVQKSAYFSKRFVKAGRVPGIRKYIEARREKLQLKKEQPLQRLSPLFIEKVIAPEILSDSTQHKLPMLAVKSKRR